MHVKLCSGKFLTWEIIKLQYSFLVSWTGEEERIKYILSNIPDDFVSHLYVSTEKKQEKGPQEDRAYRKISLLIKVSSMQGFF